MRTHKEIAIFLGLAYPTWFGRFNRIGLEEAWSYGPAQPRIPRVSKPKKATTEHIRQMKALDKLPTASSYEAQFW